jgi:hypothetical protein
MLDRKATVRWWQYDGETVRQLDWLFLHHTVVLSPSYCRTVTTVQSHCHHRTVALSPYRTVVFLYHTAILSPSYCRTVTIILSYCHHRTVALSPSYCRVSPLYCRIVTIILSYCHHRIVVLSSSYCHIFTIILSYCHHRIVVLSLSYCHHRSVMFCAFRFQRKNVGPNGTPCYLCFDMFIVKTCTICSNVKWNKINNNLEIKDACYTHSVILLSRQ